MDPFSKMFKNLVVILENGATVQVIKAGFSVRISEGMLELYREEGSLGLIRSTSRGKLKKLKIRREPTLKELYAILGVELESSLVPFLRKAEVYIKRDAFGVVTEKVRLYDLVFDTETGQVLIREGLQKRELERLRPANSLRERMSR